jgi:adenylosuccinate lyase
MTPREISPLDGRYRDRVEALGAFFSEFALVQARCEVELRFLLALDEAGIFPKLSREERARIDGLRDGFGEADFARVKEIEKEIRHDVKSCEIFLRERLALRHPNLIHFGLTSADVNSLAYALVLKRFVREVQLPQVRALLEELIARADAWKKIPFPARTHGQAASPSTAGKEIAVFVGRLLRQAEKLSVFRFRGKLSGATGTYASFLAGFPEVDWIAFSKRFVESLELDWNLCTTQIDDGDALAEYFDLTARIHGIVLDLDLDLWDYLSRGDLVQRAVAREVGSSTMPHKVNPIRFENSEGNLTVANALLRAFSEKLTRSRMQRDLSDTTVRRNIGVALAHGYLAIEETRRGLEEVDVDEARSRERVDTVPAVLAEAIQTVLRIEGVEDPYELLKGFTRGTAPTIDGLRAFVEALPIRPETKKKLEAMRPSDYVGLAPAICEATIERARAWLAAP